MPAPERSQSKELPQMKSWGELPSRYLGGEDVGTVPLQRHHTMCTHENEVGLQKGGRGFGSLELIDELGLLVPHSSENTSTEMMAPLAQDKKDSEKVV